MSISTKKKAGSQLSASLAKLNQTDADNARRFAARAAGKFVFNIETGQWFKWFQTHWVAAKRPEVQKFAMYVAAAIQKEVKFIDGEAGKQQRRAFVHRAQSLHSLDAMIRLAAAEMGHRGVHFDSDGMLLNVRNGTIDLRTGKLRPHRQEDLITKVIPIDFDPEAKAPRFNRFLKQAIDTKGVRLSLQAAVGYTLTGDIREQVFFVLHGPGRTGKSLFLNSVLKLILGDYAGGAASSTFMVKAYENGIPNDLAALAGRRSITVSEVNAGKSFDEARIKGWVGGDPINARFMHKEYFEFLPVGKLWFGLNDFPVVRESDGAFWRRVRIFPFVNQVAADNVDTALPDAFAVERAGILSWAVRGCLRWQKSGLEEHPMMRTARYAYLKKMDHFDQFWRDCCVLDSTSTVSKAALRDAYDKWCFKAKEAQVSAQALGTRLKAKGVFDKRDGQTRYWTGVKLRS